MFVFCFIKRNEQPCPFEFMNTPADCEASFDTA